MSSFFTAGFIVSGSNVCRCADYILLFSTVRSWRRLLAVYLTFVGIKGAVYRSMSLLIRLVVLTCAGATVYAMAQQGQTLNVKTLGAVGDGVADDYPALSRAAQQLCRMPEGTTLWFPPGVYRIDRYRILRGNRRNGTANIVFRGCRGVTISGDGATIDVKGDFHRPAARRQGRLAESDSIGVTPFEMIDSSDFVISGFEMNGNVDQMTRDSGVVEGGGAGILTTNCRRYRLENLFIHHFPTDGITLGGNSTIADRDALVQNVRLRNNGRQGLSIIQLRTARFVRCTFADTGRTGGTYGRHEPSAGVDIEPVRSTPEEDVVTGDLRFEECIFSENMGAQLTCIWPGHVDSLVVTGSLIQATRDDTDPVAYVAASAVSTTEQSTFVFSGRRGISFGPLQAGRIAALQSIEFRGNTIFIEHGISLYSPLQPARVSFLENTVHFTPSQSNQSSIAIANMRQVRNNRFIVHSPSPPAGTSSVELSRYQDLQYNTVAWEIGNISPPAFRFRSK